MNGKAALAIMVLAFVLGVAVALTSCSQKDGGPSTPGPAQEDPDPGEDEIAVNIDAGFTYVPEGWPMGLAVGETNAAPLSPEPYETYIAEPTYRSLQPLYGYIVLGNATDNRFGFVVDDLEQDNWILHFDANNNNDLTDDGEPMGNEGTGKFAALASVASVAIVAGQETITRPYEFWIWIIEQSGIQEIRFYPRCHYRGELSLSGKTYQAIAFEIIHQDAMYLESGLWIDLNGNEMLDEENEHFENGDAVKSDGKEYTLRLDYP